MESQGLDLPPYFKQGETWTYTWYNSFHSVGRQVLQDPGHRHGRPSCTPALVSRLQQSRGARGAHRRTEGRWQRWAQGDQEARGHRADGLGKGRSRWSSETGSSAPPVFHKRTDQCMCLRATPEAAQRTWGNSSQSPQRQEWVPSPAS